MTTRTFSVAGLTREQLVDATFGLRIEAARYSGFGTNYCFVDVVGVMVDYTPADPPTTQPDAGATVVGQPLTIDVLANDTPGSAALDPSTVTVTSDPGHGSMGVDAGTGAITSTPEAGWSGLDSLAYEVCDLNTLCATGAVALRVNAPPVGAPDRVTTGPGSPAYVPVLDNDTDPDGTLDPATLRVTVDPSFGSTEVLSAEGAIVYSPDAGHEGSDQFAYEICDDEGACTESTVDVEVLVAETPPPDDDAPSPPTNNTPGEGAGNAGGGTGTPGPEQTTSVDVTGELPATGPSVGGLTIAAAFALVLGAAVVLSAASPRFRRRTRE